MRNIEAKQATARKRGAFFPKILVNAFSSFHLPPLAKNLVRDKSGVIVIMFALLLPVLLGVIGIGVEVGGWYQSRRGLQSAADAAAIAGAYGVKSGDSEAAAYAKAKLEAERNWGGAFTAGEFNTDIMPPTSGAYTTDSSALEVELTKSVSLMFIKYLMSSSSITINARAVATVLSGGDICLMGKDTSDTGIDSGGNATVNVDNCVVVSNSSDPDAIEATGNATLIADCYYVVGGVSDTTQMTFDAGCSPTQNGAPITDPYASLTDPNAACDYPGGLTVNDGSSNPFDGSFIDPKVFCGDLWVQNGEVTLSNGIFVIDGGDLKANANGILRVVNATIILKNGARINNFNGSSLIEMSAPTSTTVSPIDSSTPGVWQDILVYQDRDTSNTCTGNNCNSLNGNSSSTFNGVMYFPNQEINIQGGNTSSGNCVRIIALRIGFSGNNTFNIDNNYCSNFAISMTVPGGVGLVE